MAAIEHSRSIGCPQSASCTISQPLGIDLSFIHPISDDGVIHFSDHHLKLIIIKPLAFAVKILLSVKVLHHETDPGLFIFRPLHDGWIMGLGSVIIQLADCTAGPISGLAIAVHC